MAKGVNLRGRPLMIGGRRKNRKWIYFFCVNAFWELFFPGEGLLRFISWRRASEIFFLNFPRASTKIIYGRPLRGKATSLEDFFRFFLGATPLMEQVLCGGLYWRSREIFPCPFIISFKAVYHGGFSGLRNCHWTKNLHLLAPYT